MPWTICGKKSANDNQDGRRSWTLEQIVWKLNDETEDDETVLHKSCVRPLLRCGFPQGERLTTYGD